MQAVAPSVRPAEFPAVTLPPTRNGVGSPARPSMLVSGRRNWSRPATVQPASVKTDMGTTVSRMTPFSQAAAAFSCPEQRVWRSRTCVILRAFGGHYFRRIFFGPVPAVFS